MCFSALVLIRPELGKTHGRAQFKQARPLLASQFERLQIVSFRIILLGMNQQVAADLVEFGNDMALTGWRLEISGVGADPDKNRREETNDPGIFSKCRRISGHPQPQRISAHFIRN